jgi:hypothetical protein
MCTPHLDYQKVNPNQELMIIGKCKDGCNDVVVNNYYFRIFKEWKTGSVTNWIECITNQSGITIIFEKIKIIKNK